jgi:hypothetical protein
MFTVAPARKFRVLAFFRCGNEPENFKLSGLITLTADWLACMY